MSIPQWKLDYYEAQPRQQTCRDCGEEGDRAYIQPQCPRRKSDLPTWQPCALCGPCIGKINSRLDADRKAQLATMDRCEIDHCHRRGAWRVAGVLLCGAHKRKAQIGHARRAAGMGGLGLFMPTPCNRADVIAWAEGGVV
jgi:hypothetical protein